MRGIQETLLCALGMLVVALSSYGLLSSLQGIIKSRSTNIYVLLFSYSSFYFPKLSLFSLFLGFLACLYDKLLNSSHHGDIIWEYAAARMAYE